MRRLKKELWPYKVTVENYTDELEAWLEENMGVFRKKWNAVYNHDQSDYYFCEQQDAAWFALRWS
jgi:hypothetical protein